MTRNLTRGPAAWTRRTAATVVAVAAATALPALRGALDEARPVAPADRPSLVAFEENRGQCGDDVRFVARAGGSLVFALDDGVRCVPQGGRGAATIRFGGGAHPVGTSPLPGRVHYLKGADPARWTKDVRRFGQVRFGGVRPGVDVVVRGSGRSLEYDFVVAPGVDPDAVRFEVQAAGGARVEDGALVVGAGAGTFVHAAPRAYQEGPEGRVAVEASFVIADAAPDRATVGFRVGDHDPARALVIDPEVTYMTYLGGTDGDEAYGAAPTADGGVVVGGTTASLDVREDGTPNTVAGLRDFFVARFGPDLATLEFLTIFGGTEDENIGAVAYDPLTDSAVLFGETRSTDFPVTAGAFQSSLRGLGPEPFDRGDGALVRLLPAGDGIAFATYLGGSYGEFCHDVTVGRKGEIAVCGRTDSADFPLVRPAQTRPGGEPNGPADAFVAKFDRNGRPIFSTYVGGSVPHGQSLALEHVVGVEMDAKGDVWAAGWTNSDDFPVRGRPYQAQRAGTGFDHDGFLVKLARKGGRIVYATCFGGTGEDFVTDVALSAAGDVHVTGQTYSTDLPLAGAFQTQLAGTNDAFLAVFDRSGRKLRASTYLGGSSTENSNYEGAVAVDVMGRVHVTGGTFSDADFPLVDATQPDIGRSRDAFFTTFPPLGAGSPVFSTYLGGRFSDVGNGVAVHPSGEVLVAGSTLSFNLPVAGGAYDGTYGGSGETYLGDAFLAAYSVDPGTLDDGKAQAPKAVNFGRVKAGATKVRKLMIRNGSRTAALIVALPKGVDEPFRVEQGLARVCLPRRGRTLVALSFTPAAAGAAETQFVLSTSDPAKPTVTVRLTGSGK